MRGGAEKVLWRATLDWRSVEAQQQTETDAVESGVTWKAVSGPEAPMLR